ncbi:MAG: hypothetical protein PHV61_07455 [Limnochordia bacterium]|nr:hypothetical protein [Limnochordia bacterium]MDD2629974.1 hypothetical protein [Limnochordia bacterium]MDD4518629.1 hypothetical protein [Limnochordia bacterium]
MRITKLVFPSFDSVNILRFVLVVLQVTTALSASLLAANSLLLLRTGFVQYQDVYLISRQTAIGSQPTQIDLDSLEDLEASLKRLLQDDSAYLGALSSTDLRGMFRVTMAKDECAYRVSRALRIDKHAMSLLGYDMREYDPALLSGEHASVVISARLRQEVFGADKGVIGQSIQISDTDAVPVGEYIVVGVYNSEAGSQEALTGGYDLLFTSTQAGSKRHFGYLVLRTEASSDLVLDCFKQAAMQTGFTFPSDVGCICYTHYLKGTADYVNCRVPFFLLLALGMVALCGAVIGLVLTINAKISEGHFNLGISRAIGIGIRYLRASVFGWTMAVCLVSVALSIPLVYGFARPLFAAIRTLTPELERLPVEYLGVSSGTFLLGFGLISMISVATAFFAAWRASKIDCVEALRLGL